VWDCAPGCPVAALGAQSGETGNGYRANSSRRNPESVAVQLPGTVVGERGHDDTGTAARFFKQVQNDRGASASTGVNSASEEGT